MKTYANIHYDGKTIQHVALDCITSTFDDEIEICYIEDGDEKILTIDPKEISFYIEFV